MQAYRGLSLSSQSLYLAVGAILLETGLRVPLIFMFAVAMVTAWYIWFPVIFARTAIVDYYKHRLAEHVNVNGGKLIKTPGSDSDAATPLKEREYAHFINFALRRKVYATMQEHFEGFKTMRQSRKKIDLYMPLLITLVWIVFTIYAL